MEDLGQKFWSIFLSCRPFFCCSLLYLNDSTCSDATEGALTTAMMGISRGHRTSAFYSPTDNPLVKLAFEGGNALLQIEILMLSEIEKSLLPEF